MSEFTPSLRIHTRIPIYLNLKVGTVVQEASGRLVPRKLNHLFYAGPHPTGSNLTYTPHPDFNPENSAHQTAHPIHLLSDDPGVNLETGYVCFQREGAESGRVLCRGNGGVPECRGTITSAGEMEARPSAPFAPLEGHVCGESCPVFAAGRCKLFGVLRFRTPGRTPIGKVDQIRTTSLNSIHELLGSMEAIKGETGGVLSGIPLRIRIEQRRGGGGTNEFQVFSIEAEASTSEELLEHVNQSRQHRQKIDALRAEAKVTEATNPTLEDRLRSIRSIGFEVGDEAVAIQQEFAPANDGVAGADVPVVPSIPQGEDPEVREAAQAILGSAPSGSTSPQSPDAAATPAPSFVPEAGGGARGATSYQWTRLWYLGYKDARNPGLLFADADQIIKRLEAERGSKG